MTTFKPRARLLKLLGDELIGSSHLAVFELIKNAYDADASTVTVTINNPSDIAKMSISVLDNGTGMTKDIIENQWLQPGTDYKKTKLDKREVSPKYKRLPLGEKGVGRFAAYKLGNTITVHTKTKEGEYKLEVDLDKALKNKYMDDIDISIEEHISKTPYISTPTGTEIIISKCTSGFDKDSIKKLNAQILSILLPFETKKSPLRTTPNPFDIELRCPEYETSIKQIDIADIVDSSMYSFEFSFEKGILDYEYRFTPNRQLKSNTKLSGREKKGVSNRLILAEKANPVRPKEFYEKLGVVKGIFYVYDFESAVMQYYNNKRILKSYTKENAGVRVYRDGIRIYNYGMPSNDWLELDQARIDDPTNSISNRLIIGAVQLESSTLPYLQEKTNREGFIENENYEVLRKTVFAIISFFNNFRTEDKKHLRLATAGKFKETIVNLNDPIQDLKNKLSEKNILKELNTEIAKVEKAYNQMRTVMLNSAVGLNSAVVMHEIEKSLIRIKNAINAEDLNGIKAEISMALRLMEGNSDLLKKDPPARYKTSEIFTNLITLTEDRFLRHNITLINNTPKGKNDIELNVSKRMVLTSLMNLIDNSIYWLSVRWYGDNKNNKKIYIGLEYIDNNPSIVIADNGSGFPAGDWADLFRPFVTTKPIGVGMGLGLYYVKTVMDTLGGQVEIIDPKVLSIKEPLDGAAIALIFKRTNDKH